MIASNNLKKIFIKSRIGLFLFTLFGIVFIIELHHPVKALLRRSYYPGMVTALFYPIVGYLYWKELLRKHEK